MIIKLGLWLIEVNIEETKALYSRLEPCDCCYCQNYAVAMNNLCSVEEKSFFTQFGINYEKPFYLSEFDEECGHLYIGIYFISGKVINTIPVDESYEFRVGRFSIDGIIPNGDEIQIRCETVFPWVLDNH